jgi:sirohydrochlorin cobaltochelatase
MSEKAILVASFGTIQEENQKKSVGALEEEAAAFFPERTLYRAWTSGFIRKRMLSAGRTPADSVEEAIDRMRKDGIRDVLVLPAFMFEGKEYRDLCRQFKEARTGENSDTGESAKAMKFERVRIARPLLSTERDLDDIIRFLTERFPSLGEDDAVILMGHGTTYGLGGIYSVLDRMLAERGIENILLGTIDSPEIGFDHVLSDLQKAAEKGRCFRHLLLMPFLMIAGNHAVVDMAGSQPDSWKSRLESTGYEVTCILQGLGESEKIRKLMLRHAEDAPEMRIG